MQICQDLTILANETLNEAGAAPSFSTVVWLVQSDNSLLRTTQEKILTFLVDVDC